MALRLAVATIRPHSHGTIAELELVHCQRQLKIARKSCRACRDESEDDGAAKILSNSNRWSINTFIPSEMMEREAWSLVDANVMIGLHIIIAVVASAARWRSWNWKGVCVCGEPYDPRMVWWHHEWMKQNAHIADAIIRAFTDFYHAQHVHLSIITLVNRTVFGRVFWCINMLWNQVIWASSGYANSHSRQSQMTPPQTGFPARIASSNPTRQNESVQVLKYYHARRIHDIWPIWYGRKINS